MAVCNKLNQNITRADSCGYSLPEIVDIYLANFDEFSGVTPTKDSDNCESISAITSAITWYHIEPAKNSASFVDELVVNDTNGSKYRTHTLTFNTIGSYTACMHKVLDDLSLGKYVAIIKTAEGTYLMLGRITGLEATTAALNGGSDNNGMQIVLAANTTESAIPVTGTFTVKS